MKNLIFIFFIAASVFSCSKLDDNVPNQFYTEVVPIDSVEMPAEFTLGETYEIHVKYYRPNSCYVFYDFYYASEQNQRTVAVINAVYPNQNCTELDNDLVDVSFNFMVNSTGSYIFRFWQGADDNGNDIYYIVEVPVVE